MRKLQTIMSVFASTKIISSSTCSYSAAASCVVSHMVGTLPSGKSVPGVPVHALIEPSILSIQKRDLPSSSLETIPLDGAMAFLVRDVVTPAEADELAKFSTHLGFRPEAPGIQTAPGMRENETVHWILREDMMEALFHNVCRFLPENIESRRPLSGLSQRMNVYRYHKGQQFRDHVDGNWPAYRLNEEKTQMIEVEGKTSEISMLLYLTDQNDDEKGGQTRLYTHKRDKYVDVAPRKGSALFFRHGFGSESVLHAGRPIMNEGSEKMVARVNVMYDNHYC